MTKEKNEHEQGEATGRYQHFIQKKGVNLKVDRIVKISLLEEQ